MPLRANPAPRLRAALLIAAGLVSAPLAAQDAAPPPASPSKGAPKSLLPDDFATPPPAAPLQPEAPTQLAVPADTQGGFAPLPAPPPPPAPLPEPEKPDPLATLAGPKTDPAFAGFLTPENGGYSESLFVSSDGRYLATLLNRLDGPLASRWAQILLQRALVSRAAAPATIAPGDWVAARGLALVNMGDGADAHRLVSAIAIDSYTKRLYGAALQAALAAADPMALCPLSPTARLMNDTPSWTLVDAMCLAMLGDDIGATSMFDRLRKDGDIVAFDIGLAERVASTTGGGRRGANPEWGEAKSGLTGWRLGMATAAGLEIPDDLVAGASPAEKAWAVRLAGQGLARRAALAPAAAATGALSTAELNRILAAEADSLESRQSPSSPGGLLRTAQVAASVSDRLEAMRTLWARGAKGSAEHYGWLIATAPAAARIPASSGLEGDAPMLVASFVSAGITRPADLWWRAMSDADEAVRAEVWAMLAPVSNGVPMESGLYESWSRSVSSHRAQLLAAGLRGLGRGDAGANWPALENDWTRSLDDAVAARRSGEVMVLVATGLQGSWAEVPPDYLRRIAAALVAIGHTAEARMIVAEAAVRG